jgi:diaminopimelate epimerase
MVSWKEKSRWTRGGRLLVTWPGVGEHIWLTGPTETAFEGRVEI